jgi:ankyrin repeat protein
MTCLLLKVDERNDGGTTPLALAAADGHLSLLARLASLGADINAANKYGMTPLHRCALMRAWPHYH